MKKNNRQITYAQAINEAIDISLDKDKSVFLIGLGVTDPIGVFGSTKGLQEKHGNNRVFEMPISESAVTGVCLGSSLVGMRPIMTHMRLEFAITAMDQICNQAAKWHYMFGGKDKAPVTIRMIVGRGWGQGAQHSQSLHNWFAHVPGLKVVMPATPYDAKGLLISSIEDDAPTIFIEHRWLYNISGYVPKEYYKVSIGQPNIIKEGSDVTLITSSYTTLDGKRAAEKLEKFNISVEHIDLRTISPINYELIFKSIRKTGKLVVCDQGTKSSGFASEVITRILENEFNSLHSKPIRITLPDTPTPTSRALSNYYYPQPEHIIFQISKMFNFPYKDPSATINSDDFLDVPDQSFKGPF